MVIAIIIQAIFNWINTRKDAYRIMKHKTIAHGINFTAYAILVSIQLMILKLWWPVAILFCVQAFLNRQNTFDIPLNLRRGLDKFYQTKDPKALMDKIEYWVFGYNPKAIAWTYIILWCITLVLILLIYLNIF